MLSDACRLVLDEIYIPPDAEGGMVEYRRTLIISLLFKFYLKVRRGLNKMVRTTSPGIWAPWPSGHEPAHEGPPQPGFNNTQRVSRVGPSGGASPPPTACPHPQYPFQPTYIRFSQSPAAKVGNNPSVADAQINAESLGYQSGSDGVGIWQLRSCLSSKSSHPSFFSP